VHTDFIVENFPLAGTGTHDQFWVHMAISSISFQGRGDKRVPPNPPTANLIKSLLLNSMFYTLILIAQNLACPVK